MSADAGKDSEWLTWRNLSRTGFDAKLWRYRAEDSPKGRRGKKVDDGLGVVGRQGRDAVTRADPKLPHSTRHLSDLEIELVKREGTQEGARQPIMARDRRVGLDAIDNR